MPATPAPITIQMLACLGYLNQANTTIFQFAAPPSWTAAFAGKTVVTLPPNTNNINVPLSTLFPGITNCYGIFVQEVTAVPLGFSVGDSTGNTEPMAPSGFYAKSPNGGVPQNLFFGNTTASPVNVEIGVFGT